MSHLSQPATDSGRRLRILKIAGVLVTVLLLLGLLGVVVVATFSVGVSGDSMRPTLEPGDRVELKLWDRDLHRFDLVDAAQPESGTAIVKRVIGLPGDRLTIRGGAMPRVLIQPEGQKQVYRVTSTPWVTQVGARTASCCSREGRESTKSGWVTVPSDAFWLVGDNWGGSTDSRTFGFVKQSEIRAKLWVRIQPSDRLGAIAHDFELVPVGISSS